MELTEALALVCVMVRLEAVPLRYTLKVGAEVKGAGAIHSKRWLCPVTSLIMLMLLRWLWICLELSLASSSRLPQSPQSQGSMSVGSYSRRRLF